ncbi:hypothetical protein DF185_16250 [Marinifilum breve]|uniref:Uncharacterized protein n=1 Tax=Marinifilum breve TaxID=2184082 RepID=A0A2V3ZVF7_9BACT|nr:hypothetical protein DF185_16250 [Marinifilum breve]
MLGRELVLRKARTIQQYNNQSKSFNSTRINFSLLKLEEKHKNKSQINKKFYSIIMIYPPPFHQVSYTIDNTFL